VRPLDGAIVERNRRVPSSGVCAANPPRWRSMPSRSRRLRAHRATLAANAAHHGNPLFFAYDALNGSAHRLGLSRRFPRQGAHARCMD